MPHSLKPRSGSWIFLCVVTLIAYHPAWNGKPIWDDDAHITKPELRSFSGLAKIWTQPGATQQYYPLVHSVFWLEHRLWGDSTLGYHLGQYSVTLLFRAIVGLHPAPPAIPGAWFRSGDIRAASGAG